MIVLIIHAMSLHTPSDSFEASQESTERTPLPEELKELLRFQESFGMEILREKILAAKKDPETFRRLMGEYQEMAWHQADAISVHEDKRESILYLLKMYQMQHPEDPGIMAALQATLALRTLGEVKYITMHLRDRDLATQVVKLADERWWWHAELSVALLSSHIYKLAGKTEAWIEALGDVHKWAGMGNHARALEYIGQNACLQEVREFMQQFSEAQKVHDSAQLATLIAEKATCIFPDGQKHATREKIEAAFHHMWDVSKDAQFLMEDITWHAAYDDFAYCTYDFQWSGTVEEPKLIRGRGRNILRKQEGSWKLMRQNLQVQTIESPQADRADASDPSSKNEPSSLPS